jgi:hypothetical protein
LFFGDAVLGCDFSCNLGFGQSFCHKFGRLVMLMVNVYGHIKAVEEVRAKKKPR